jgi:hypothetical protein
VLSGVSVCRTVETGNGPKRLTSGHIASKSSLRKCYTRDDEAELEHWKGFEGRRVGRNREAEVNHRRCMVLDSAALHVSAGPELVTGLLCPIKGQTLDGLAKVDR